MAQDTEKIKVDVSVNVNGLEEATAKLNQLNVTIAKAIMDVKELKETLEGLSLEVDV